MSATEPAVGAAAVEANLKVVGRVDLDAGSGPVAVVGTTALVVTSPAVNVGCASSTLSVVSVANPAHPRVVARLDLPAGLAATGVDTLDIATPSFTAELVAVALSTSDDRTACLERADAGVSYYSLQERPSRNS